MPENFRAVSSDAAVGRSFNERTVAGVAILDLSGRLTEALGNQMLTRVRELAEAGSRDVLLNLAGVSYVDSEGLGNMVAAVTALRRHDGTLKLLQPTPWMRELLRITALNTVMEAFESEASAIASFARLARPAAG